MIKILLFFCLFWPICAESVAKLKLMHQKNPQDTTILFYLGQGLLLENSFREALFYFEKIGGQATSKRGQATFSSADLAYGKARCYLGLQYPYEAFSLCIPLMEDQQCASTLDWIEKNLGLHVMDSFVLRYQYEQENNLDWQKMAKLFGENPHNAYLLDFCGELLFSHQQLEIAYDIWQIADLLSPDRKEKYAILARLYRKKLDESSFFDQETAFYFYYYLKYEPLLGLKYKRYTLAAVRDFFIDLVSYEGNDGFENFYRLAYLYYLLGDTTASLQSLGKAIAKSPDSFYQTFFRLLADDVFGKPLPKAFEIGTNELKK